MQSVMNFFRYEREKEHIVIEPPTLKPLWRPKKDQLLPETEFDDLPTVPLSKEITRESKMIVFIFQINIDKD